MQRVPQVDRWLETLRSYQRVALDTNIVIYALEAVEPYRELAQHLLRLIERGLMMGLVSTLVEAEVLVKPVRERDRMALEKVALFFRKSPNLVVRTFDSAVARRAALVRATSRLLLPDAIIVATAIEEKCEVIIGNDATLAQQAIGIPYLHLDSYVT